MPRLSDPPSSGDSRATPLVREVLWLQVKLAIDALRDVVLSPLTIGGALLDFVLVKHQEPRYFRMALKLGKRSDEWIDLWSAVEDRPGKPPENVDALLNRVEHIVRDPATGARRARVLKRWAERQLRHQKARTETVLPPATMPPPPPPAPPQS